MSSCSSLPSTVNVTMPSMSAGVSPASRIAARLASAASCISLRPDCFENSVAPIPATMVPVTIDLRRGHREERRARAAVVAELDDHRRGRRRDRRAAGRPGSRPGGCPPRARPGSRCAVRRRDGSGGATRSTCTIRPRPVDSCASHSSDPHAPHIGAGGWRSVPHSAQRWMTSRSSAAASQKKASSGFARRGASVSMRGRLRRRGGPETRVPECVRCCLSLGREGGTMHRVILWGPGQIGVGALRAVIQHPALELVGLIVHSEHKEGRDAGDLCGLPTTGVVATRDVDAALAVEADVVAYFASADYRYEEAADDLARCLRAGHDVVTTSLVTFCYPPAAEPRPPRACSRPRARRAAPPSSTAASNRAGSTTSCPCAFSGACARIDKITMQEILDYAPIAQPVDHVRLHGVRAPARRRHPAPRSAAGSSTSWSPVIWGLAAAHDLELDRIDDTLEKWVTPGVVRDRVGSAPRGHRRRRCGSGSSASPTARSGSCSSTSRGWASTRRPTGRDTRHPSAATASSSTACRPTPSTSRCTGEGATCAASRFATFMRPLNAIPAVVAAAPGIVSTYDLPLIAGRHGRRRVDRGDPVSE